MAIEPCKLEEGISKAEAAEALVAPWVYQSCHEVWVDYCLENKDFKKLFMILSSDLAQANLIGQDGAVSHVTTEGLRERGFPQHEAGKILDMDIEVSVAEALRSPFEDEEIKNMITAFPSTGLPSDTLSHISVLRVLLDPETHAADIHSALETLRLSATGLLFHIRYQVKGQALKKRAAGCSWISTSSALWLTKLKKMSECLSGLDMKKLDGWGDVWSKVMEIQSEASSNEAFMKLHHDELESACQSVISVRRNKILESITAINEKMASMFDNGSLVDRGVILKVSADV